MGKIIFIYIEMMLRKKDFMYKNLTWVLVENSNSKVLSNIDKFAIIFIFYMRTYPKLYE